MGAGGDQPCALTFEGESGGRGGRGLWPWGRGRGLWPRGRGRGAWRRAGRCVGELQPEPRGARQGEGRYGEEVVGLGLVGQRQGKCACRVQAQAVAVVWAGGVFVVAAAVQGAARQHLVPRQNTGQVTAAGPGLGAGPVGGGSRLESGWVQVPGACSARPCRPRADWLRAAGRQCCGQVRCGQVRTPRR